MNHLNGASVPARDFKDSPLADRNLAAEPAGGMPQEYAKELDRIVEIVIYSFLAMNFKLRNMPLRDFIRNLEKNLITSCLNLTLWNQKETASVLGMKPSTLCEKIKKLSIKEKNAGNSQQVVSLISNSIKILLDSRYQAADFKQFKN